VLAVGWRVYVCESVHIHYRERKKDYFMLQISYNKNSFSFAFLLKNGNSDVVGHSFFKSRAEVLCC